MFSLISLFIFHAFAASTSTNAFEKTYIRDNTYCSFGGKQIELMIRGVNKFSESRELGYGEVLFYKRQHKKPKLLKVQLQGSDTYRLFLGNNTLCSKSHGHKIDENTIAVLLLKENRPFVDKLVIQLFDSKNLTPKEMIDTNLPANMAMKAENGFLFRTFEESNEREVGKVVISGETYIYQEKYFPIWMKYSSSGIIPAPDMTFEDFPYRHFFKDLLDFDSTSGWNGETKQYSKKFLYEAVNHQTRRQCILFLEAKTKVTGSESWRCQPMKDV
jgi:hypothetical protein